jgi:hypothetical protein
MVSKVEDVLAAYMNGSQQSLDTAVEQLHVALLAYQTLFSDGCRRFGATKDTVECAFMPLIEALRLESYVYDVKWCAEGKVKTEAPKVRLDRMPVVLIKMIGSKDFASGLAEFQSEQMLEYKDCSVYKSKLQVILRRDQQTLMFTLWDNRAEASRKFMNERILIQDTPMNLLSFVKFASRKKGIDHFVAGVREEDGSWTEFNDSRVTKHANYQAILERSYGGPKNAQFYVVLYAREGYQPKLQGHRRGLRNFGNTCYMNAALQLLFRHADFFDKVAPRAAGLEGEEEGLWIGSPEHSESESD